MKTKKPPLTHLFRKKDIFESTQFRLTLLYSGLLMLFLVVFIAVVYTILYATIFKDQERELKSSVSQEARNIENYLKYQDHEGHLDFRNQESLVKDVDQFFYYVVNLSGEVVLGDERIPELRPKILTTISNSEPGRNKILQENFQVEFSKKRENDRDRRDEFRPAQRTDTIRLIIAGQPIYYDGKVIGMLYIGKEISLAYQVFRWLLIILIVLAVLFSGVALIISYYMSKKAMVPITRAFSRQQEFTADASHELRTPLSIMLSSINALEMTLDLKKEDYSNKLLFNMKNEVKRMTGLVSDLLTLARSDSGIVEHVTESFDFCQVAEEVIESVRSIAESKQIKLYFDAPKTLFINGDSQRLTQLLYILLDNAIKYTGNGGEAQLSLSLEEKNLLITMTDTGVGISSEDHEHIFERFYRVDKARTRQVGGHGLGLPIAKWIVESHKGTIQVSSEKDKGSTFFIKIPIK
ncbi:sensor histidine kinase [Metabacillus fastidiosus]|uniref:sensor histidine kinase n=1 Tax=Metabacillus fastidiosus TaxID=1458 RepID=UPI002E1B7263|nr:ATP-binding protein [Metabacillus fastidiosus]